MNRLVRSGSAARRDPGRRRAAVSLRARVACAFGLVALVVTGVLALATWQIARGFALDQRERSVAGQAAVAAQLVANGPARSVREVDSLLTGLAGDPDTAVLVRRGDRWITAGRPVDPARLPADLLADPTGVPVPRQVPPAPDTVLAVARPIGSGGDLLVLLAPLNELHRVVRFLAVVLATGTVVAGALATMLGWWTARRALRPLAELTRAAGRMADGDLSARLPDRAEPDLAPLARRFNTTAEALAERVRADARFAGDVSHELRSPLTTMLNAGAVLERRRDELPATALRALDLLQREMARFHRTVEDLLEISRGLQVPHADDLEPVDLGAVIANLPAHLTDGAEVDVPAPAPLVLAERRRLDRVLVNLCENARHHGGGLVRLAVRRDHGRVRIEVDDAGPGVPVEARERVFERFARGPGADRATGSGLGLALVAQHVRGHGGRVWVDDRPGGGARFVVELPDADAGEPRSPP